MFSLYKSASGEPTGMHEEYKKVYNLEQIYLRIGDQYETILGNQNLPLLDPSAGMDQETVFRLALIVAFQFGEALPDPAAAEATLFRSDWRYALHLPLKHPGINARKLCQFRESLFSSAEALKELQQLLDCLGNIGLYARETKNRLDAGEVITTICMLNRFHHLNEAMKTALSCLVSAEPDWLRANALPHWFECYKTGRISNSIAPSSEAMQKEAARLGKDIQHLLNALNEQNMSAVIAQAEIRTIEHLLKEEFTNSSNQIRWHLPVCTTCICNSLRSI